MKRILLIILISFLGRDLIGQPITKRGGASVTVNDENLFVGKSFRVPVFTDTTAANLAVTLDSAGKLIFTYDINGLWLRESNPKKWVEVGSGGGGSGGGIVSLGIVGNYGLTRINDSTYRVDTLAISTVDRLYHVADSIAALIGDANIGMISRYLKGKNVYFFGDSYTSGATVLKKYRWTTIFSKALGANEVNFGVQGTTMEKRVPINYINSPNMVDNIVNIPVKTTADGLLVIAFGLNDLGQTAAAYNTTNYITDYSTVLDSAIARGWSDSSILLVSPYWIGQLGYNAYATLTGNPAPTLSRHLSFIEATKTVASTYNTLFINIFNDQLNNDTTLINSTDHIHATEAGNAFIAFDILKYLGNNYTSVTGGNANQYNLQFPINTNLTHTDTIWYGLGGGSGYGHTGLSNTFLPGGMNGRIVLDEGSAFAVMGFDPVNAQTGYAPMKAAIVAVLGNIYSIDNGTLSGALVAQTAGYKYCVYRNGSTFKIQYSSDSGSTWVDISTLGYTNSDTMYIVCDTHLGTDGGLLIHPQFYIDAGDIEGGVLFSNGFSQNQDGLNLNWDNRKKRLGIGTSSPTAILDISTAGTAAAGTAPIKLNSGVALTTPEDGAIEYHGSHIYFTIGSTRYQLDQQAGTNLGNSNLTQTGGNRTYTGAGQNLIFNGSGGTSLFNVEYNSIILTAQNSGVNIQGDSILISANVGKVYIDSLPPSIDAIDSVVVITPTGQLKQKAQSDLVGGLLSGTYTPTLTNVANVSASTAYSCQWSRSGSVITVSGEVDIDPTTTVTLTQLGISLPVASALANANELAGTSADDLNTAARVAGDATNNRAEIRMTPVDVTNRRFSFTFTYRVL